MGKQTGGSSTSKTARPSAVTFRQPWYAPSMRVVPMIVDKNASWEAGAILPKCPTLPLRTDRTPQGCPKRTASSWICTASSRVGASNKASGPSPSLSTG
eukprot:scaffold129727_cov31-Tisochrysis_lutea.AAC.3